MYSFRGLFEKGQEPLYYFNFNVRIPLLTISLNLSLSRFK